MAIDYIPHDGPIVTRAEAKAQGLTRYFKGEPCKEGHLSERSVKKSGCIECDRLRSDKWRDKNREHVRATCAAWKTANAEKVKADNAALYLREKKRIDERNKTWAEVNRDKINQTERERYRKNPGKFKAKRAAPGARAAHRRYWIRYYAENAKRYAEGARHRRAKIKNAAGRYTASEIGRLAERQKYRCANPACRKLIRKGFHIDHVIPLSKGGSNWISNIQLLCAPCNLSKAAKHPIDWAQENGLLL